MRKKSRIKKNICDMESLTIALEGRVEQALSRSVTFGEEEVKQLEKWLKKVKPYTISENSFVNRVKYDMSAIEHGYSIIKIALSPEMNIRRYSDFEGVVEMGFSLEKLEEIIQNLFLDKKLRVEIATCEEVELLKAYKVATNWISLESICECGCKVDNPREFYRGTDGYKFSGGRGWAIADVQRIRDGMITIQPYDSLVMVVRNM